MRWSVSGFVLIFLIFGSCGNLFQTDPHLLMLDFDYLKRVNKGIRERSPIYLPSYSRLCKEAENALLKNYRVFIFGQNVILQSSIRTNFFCEEMQFTETVSGGIHPKQRGENNLMHEKEAVTQNDQYFLEMVNDISTLTLAWFFSKDERYAEKASELIGNWFMNAEINNEDKDGKFPNEVQYNAISLFDARGYIDIIDAIALLEKSDSWNIRATVKIRRWFSDYLQWLIESENGLNEKNQKNFRGTWYDVQLASYALFSGKREIAREAIGYSLARRIPRQFDGRGLQKFELISLESYSNSCINLEGHIVLGKIADYTGIDYWNDPSMPVNIIQAAYDYIFSFIGKEDQWPYPQSEPVEPGRMVKLVRESEKIFHNPAYKMYLELLKPEIKSNSRLIILNYYN